MPNYHGWHLTLWIVVPALLACAAWSAVSPGLVQQAVLGDPAAAELPAMDMERQAILAEARALASDPDAAAFNRLAGELAAPFREAQNRFGLIGAALVAVFAFVGGAWGFTRLRAGFPARTWVERGVMLALLLASLVAILTTFGIIVSLLYETGLFFAQVSPVDFLTGTHWAPG